MYVRELLMTLVIMHSTVYATARQYASRALAELMGVIAADLLKAVETITDFGRYGLKQVCFDEKNLCACTIKSSIFASLTFWP